MGLTFDISVSAFTVFLQGILSFFSPCVLPILPVYISYFSGGAKTIHEDGTITYNQKKVFLHTLLFVLGISITFFVLGFGFTAFGQFFTQNQSIIAGISGIIMIFFGIYQLGFFKKIVSLESEHRLNLKFNTENLGLFSTFLLGFTFSFAWTPCIGPILTSVLLMASSSEQSSRAFLLILCYTLGFIIPFLVVGIFTTSVLGFFKKHQNIIKYSIKIGAILLILMGTMTLFSISTLSNEQTVQAETTQNEENIAIEETDNTDDAESTADENRTSTDDSAEEVDDNEVQTIPIFDFTLEDQYGQSHTLSEYEGQVVFLNFWATWCSPCKEELPYIQQIYEEYGLNAEDVVILSVVRPNLGQEGDTEYITEFLSTNELSYPVLMDTTGSVMSNYGISAFPTTFMIDKNSNIYGYVTGGLPYETMQSIVDQTLAIE
ncbi:MAG: cytochrome c biogenesis protein/redoxin [Clostridia bacterium]